MKKFLLLVSLLGLSATSISFASSGSAKTGRSSKWDKKGCEYNGLEIQGSMNWVQNATNANFIVKLVELDDIDDVEIFFYVGDATDKLPHVQCGVLWLPAFGSNPRLLFKQMRWNEAYHWIGMEVPCPELAGVATDDKKSDVEFYYAKRKEDRVCEKAKALTLAPASNASAPVTASP